MPRRRKMREKERRCFTRTRVMFKRSGIPRSPVGEAATKGRCIILKVGRVFQHFGRFAGVRNRDGAQCARRKPLAPSQPTDDSLPPPGKPAVTSTIEAQKAARIRDAQLLASQKAQASEHVLLHRFIAELYEHVPPDD